MMDLYEKPLKSEEPVYSFHSFIFPFEWRYNNSEISSLDDQTSLGLVEMLMTGRNSEWERRASWRDPKTLVQFNESAYFYDFARPALYDTGKKSSFLRHYYNKKASNDCEYIINLKNGKSYSLEVDDIVLSFYDTGVGVIAFHLLNKKKEQSSPNDILTINAMGRRLYPPYFNTNTDLIGQQAFFDDANWELGLDGVKKSELVADKIRIEKNGEPWVRDDFTGWLINQKLDQEPELIRQLIPSIVLRSIKIKPVLDDRMFTVCWYGNQSLVQQVKGDKADQDFQNNEWWYKYVFVDEGGKTCQSDRMTQELLEKATNDRWSNYGTYYGVSRYSFVALTDNISVNGFSALLCSHLQTMYYKIALLGLVQRATMLRFSDEIAVIADLESSKRSIYRRVESLNRQYIRFVNRIYFREVTAQEQGIELYDILQEQMRLPDQVKELEKEIQELYQYAQILEEGVRNEKLDILTYIATFFVVPSFIGTYFGINEFDMDKHWLSVSVLCVVAAGMAFGTIKSGKKWRAIWLIATALFMIYTLFIYPKIGF